MIGTDHDEDAFTRDQLLGAAECVLEHGTATSNRTELLNAAPTTELSQELTYTCAFACS
jgi:hypothetical protein